MRWKWDDGGREAAGFKGQAPGDCVARAIAIASGMPYRRVYNDLNRYAGKPVARYGVQCKIYRRYLADLGAVWTPAMTIGSGCRVHLNDDEFPSSGRYVARLSKHLCAVVDGVARDLYDPSPGGRRCVYGWWEFTTEG